MLNGNTNQTISISFFRTQREFCIRFVAKKKYSFFPFFVNFFFQMGEHLLIVL